MVSAASALKYSHVLGPQNFQKYWQVFKLETKPLQCEFPFHTVMCRMARTQVMCSNSGIRGGLSFSGTTLTKTRGEPVSGRKAGVGC